MAEVAPVIEDEDVLEISLLDNFVTALIAERDNIEVEEVDLDYIRQRRKSCDYPMAKIVSSTHCPLDLSGISI